MLRVSLVQAFRRLGRTLAVVLAIVMASVSFALLTSAVASSRLEVRGTIEDNFRSAYDILVRPDGTRLPLERSESLVQQNFLTGTGGGITLKQVRQVAGVPGVEVAAPVAMIGYTLPAIQIPVPLGEDELAKGRDQLFSFEPSWRTDRGLSSLPDRRTYLYYTQRKVDWNSEDRTGARMRHPGSGKTVNVCQRWLDNHWRPERSAFDLARKTDLVCDSSNPPAPGQPLGVLKHGQSGFNFYYQIPLFIAAVDPVAEAKLVGLDEAVIQGRYLTANDRTRAVRESNRTTSGRYLDVPVLMSSRPLTDDQLTLRVRRLEFGSPAELVDELSRPKAEGWLDTLAGKTVLTETYDDTTVYPRLLHEYRGRGLKAKVDFWSAGPSTYEPAPDGRLRAAPSGPIDPEVFRNRYFGGYNAPQASGDVGFRTLGLQEGSTAFVNGMLASPGLRQVGMFDPEKIEGFSAVSEVPLTTYHSPDAAAADARSKMLLKGQDLLPNGNLAGYLQQPPMILTTLKALPIFYDTDAYPDTDAEWAKAPVSVIRVRVAGVTGVDETSRERVRLAAEQIARTTGLSVDITMGSSPTPKTIEIAAGKFGRPDLAVTEGWAKKGVSVTLIEEVDRKSLALFGLVLLTCLLFLSNATLAAVRTRRSELGVLACLGWPRSRIFAMLQAELLLTGLVAGLLGTALAAAIVAAAGLEVTWWHLALITPVSTVLAAGAGIWPAWQAARADPIEAIRTSARAPRRPGRHVDSITGLALTSLRRLPGRTLFGAASLFVGVAALTVLLALQQAFRASAAGTALGDVISIQVRGVDLLAAIVTIALGAFAVADIAYLNISERTSEIGTLRSVGWTEAHIRRLFATEALVTALLGATAGALLGLTGTALLLPIPIGDILLPALLALAGGTAAAMATTAGPVSRLHRLAPATALNE